MSAPKRVLLLDTGNEWGGGTNSMFELLKRIDRSRFDVTCCFYTDYKKGQTGRLLSEELADIGIPLVLLPILKQPLWAKLAKELMRALLSWSKYLKRKAVYAIDMQWRIRPRSDALEQLLRYGGYDLLYMNNQPSSNLEGFLAADSVKIPVIQHARIDVVLKAHEISIVNRVAKRVICNSFGLANSLRDQGILTEKVTVVHNGIDLQSLMPPKANFARDEKELILGTVGSLIERKCIDHLILCLAKLNHELGVKSRLVVVGEGPELLHLMDTAKQNSIDSAVIFVGFSQNPLEWIQLFDIFLFASRQEGFGRVLIEAMLCKIPIISADVVGPNEVVEHGGTGFLYHHGDIDALARYVTLMSSDSLLRQQYGEAGYLRVASKFSIDNYVNGVTEVFSEVTA